MKCDLLRTCAVIVGALKDRVQLSLAECIRIEKKRSKQIIFRRWERYSRFCVSEDEKDILGSEFSEDEKDILGSEFSEDEKDILGFGFSEDEKDILGFGFSCWF